LKKVGKKSDQNWFVWWGFRNLHALGYPKTVILSKCENFWVNSSLSMMCTTTMTFFWNCEIPLATANLELADQCINGPLPDLLLRWQHLLEGGMSVSDFVLALGNPNKQSMTPVYFRVFLLWLMYRKHSTLASWSSRRLSNLFLSIGKWNWVTQRKVDKLINSVRHPILYGLPHGIPHNEFQNPQISQRTLRLFPEQSTLLPVDTVSIGSAGIQNRALLRNLFWNYAPGHEDTLSIELETW
jgi:hypothetical protein